MNDDTQQAHRVEVGEVRPSASLPAEEGELPPFLTAKEAAAHLRVSVWAVYDAVRAGTLPAVRIGRVIRIPRHVVVIDIRSGVQGEA